MHPRPGPPHQLRRPLLRLCSQAGADASVRPARLGPSGPGQDGPPTARRAWLKLLAAESGPAARSEGPAVRGTWVPGLSPRLRTAPCSPAEVKDGAADRG